MAPPLRPRAALALLLLVVGASLAAPDPLDVASPMQDEEVFRDTMRCVLEANFGFCDYNRYNIKLTIWSLILYGCDSCRDDDQKGYDFMAYLSKERPSEWQQVLNKFDPQGEYRKKNAAQWKQYGVAV